MPTASAARKLTPKTAHFSLIPTAAPPVHLFYGNTFGQIPGLVNIQALVGRDIIAKELHHDDGEGGGEYLRARGQADEREVLRRLRFRVAPDEEHLRVTADDLLYVAHHLAIEPRTVRERDNQRILLNERDRPVLEFTARVRFGVDVGDLFELERALQGDGVVYISSDEENALSADTGGGVFLDIVHLL
jgi:hypothetical protein